jgi:hypothetical protein
MAIPKKIPIERIERYHTHYVGKTLDEKQFWGYTTFVFTKPYSEIIGNWQDYRDEYAILHIFDKQGICLDTKHILVGTANQVDDITLYTKLEEIVAELGIIEFADIEVELFNTEINGIVFGLIPNEEYGVVDLEPSSTISFGEPWDGSYST